jgi:hypothetical protein
VKLPCILHCMEPNTPPNHKRAIILLFTLLIITILGAIVPVSWFQAGKTEDHTLDLTSVNSIDITPKDKATNQPLTWKQIAEDALSDQPDALEQLKSAPIDDETVTQLNDKENLTASFSKNLLVASTYLKDNNVTDEAAKQQVISQLVAQEAAKVVPTSYSFKDLNIAKVESRDSIKKYGNDVGLALSGFITEKSMNADIKALHDYTENKDTSTLTPLIKDSKKVTTVLQSMLKISVPASASIYHLAAINQISKYQDTLSNMSKVATDPMRANIGLTGYASTVVSTISIYSNLSDYFNVKNIVFGPKDGGYVFTIGYTPK